MPDKPTTHWLETNKPSLQQTQCDSISRAVTARRGDSDHDQPMRHRPPPRGVPSRSRQRGSRLMGACVVAALALSAVTAVAAPAEAQQGNGEVRIVARKLESGRVEFGFQQRRSDNTWGERQLPRVRFFPTSATVGRWLASSPLTLAAHQTAAGYSAVAAGEDHSCALRTDGTITCWGNNSFR